MFDITQAFDETPARDNMQAHDKYARWIVHDAFSRVFMHMEMKCRWPVASGQHGRGCTPALMHALAASAADWRQAMARRSDPESNMANIR